jgi:tetratricopeptide (TPR) repeat protein
VLADRGEFGTALRHADNALQVAEQGGHAYTKAIAWTLGGLVWLRRGFPGRAVQPLQRSLQACKEAHLPLWQPVASSVLGLSLVMLDALDEGLPLLEEAVRLTAELGVKAHLPLWKAHLAEGLLAAGQTERARLQAQEALELAVAHQERGHQAWTLRLLGEIAAQDGPQGIEQATKHCTDALGLAQELSARPLVALCHLSLGRLYRQARMLRKAEEHLAESLPLCLGMGLGVWGERAATELKQLGQIWIVSSSEAALYHQLTQDVASKAAVEVILDRRQQARQPDAQASQPAWVGPERRRVAPISGELRARGFAVVRREAATPAAA